MSLSDFTAEELAEAEELADVIAKGVDGIYDQLNHKENSFSRVQIAVGIMIRLCERAVNEAPTPEVAFKVLRTSLDEMEKAIITNPNYKIKK